MRSSIKPLARWIPVTIQRESSQCIFMVVNPQLLGWHYSWRSMKSKSHTKHRLRVYLCGVLRPGDQQVKVLAKVREVFISLIIK